MTTLPTAAMNEWIALGPDALVDALNPAEMEALAPYRGADAQDPVPGIARGIAARIRSAVAAGGRLGVPGGMGESSIPLALYNEACAILRLKLLVRYALAVTAERKAEADAAEARIDAVAKGEIPLAGGPVATAPTYHARPKRWGFSQTGGIM